MLFKSNLRSVSLIKFTYVFISSYIDVIDYIKYSSRMDIPRQ